MTSSTDIEAVLADTERVAYPQLLARLKAAGLPVSGVRSALREGPFIMRWASGEIDYGQYYGDENFDGGPLFVERACAGPSPSAGPTSS